MERSRSCKSTGAQEPSSIGVIFLLFVLFLPFTFEKLHGSPEGVRAVFPIVQGSCDLSSERGKLETRSCTASCNNSDPPACARQEPRGDFVPVVQGDWDMSASTRQQFG